MGYNGSDRVCYLGNVGVFRGSDRRPGVDEYGMGGAACTYWNIDRKDDTATVWFTQHVEMPEFSDIPGVDEDRADLWKTLHQARKPPMKSSGVKRKGSPSSAGASTKAKKTRK